MRHQSRTIKNRIIMKHTKIISSFAALLFAMLCSVNAFAQDVKLSVEKCYLNPGNTATVTVKLKSDVVIGTLSTTINLPEGLSFVKKEGSDLLQCSATELSSTADAKAELYMKGNEHSASIDVTRRPAFEKFDGDFFTFDVNVDKDLAVLDKISFSKISAVYTHKNEETGKYDVDEYSQDDFAANVYNESRLMTPSVEPFTIGASQTKTVSLCLANTDAISALSFKMEVPEGLTVSSYEVDETRLPHHSVTTSKKGTIYVMADGSSSDVDFVGNEGAILTFNVTASKDFGNDTELKFYDISGATKSVNGKVDNYYAKDFTVKVTFDKTTGITSVDSFSEAADGIYQLNGVRTDKLQRGVNIVVKNGKAVKVVKK